MMIRKKLIMRMIFFGMLVAVFAAWAQIPIVSTSVAQTPTVAEPEEAEADSIDPLSYTRPRLTYDSGDRRDPFGSLVPDSPTGDEVRIKGDFDYEDALIKGIVITEEDKFALVADDSDDGYVLREGYRVLGGYVTRITADTVYLHIVKYGRSMSIIMRMESSHNTVIAETDADEKTMRKPGITVSYNENEIGDDRVTVEDVMVPSTDVTLIEEDWFGTSDRTLFTVPDDGDTPGEGGFSVISPVNESWVTLPYVLDWTMVQNTDVTYTVVIDDDSDFSSPILEKMSIPMSSLLIDTNTGLPGTTTLYWQVYATDADGRNIMSRRTGLTFKIR
jgi:hypothetical protein